MIKQLICILEILNMEKLLKIIKKLFFFKLNPGIFIKVNNKLVKFILKAIDFLIRLKNKNIILSSILVELNIF